MRYIKTGYKELQYIEAVSNATTANNIVVALDSTGKFIVADKQSDTTCFAVGFAKGALTTNYIGRALCSGSIIGGFSSLTPGASVFLGNSGGIIQDDTTIGAGEYRVHLGVALSATEIIVSIQEPVLITAGGSVNPPVVLSANSLDTESALSVTSTSTDRATGSSLLSAISSGANTLGSITIRGITSDISNSGTTNTNIAYYATASGGSTNNYSFYGAAGKIYNADTTASSSTTTGSVIIAGGIGCAGEIWASAVHGAVWNDIADFILVEDDVEIEFGRVYCFNGKRHKMASKYAENGIVGIASDTFGFSIGKKDSGKQIPIAIGGFVLAHCDKVYPSGTPLTTSKDNTLVKASIITKMFSPEKIVATFYKVESSTMWNKINVNGRHWVKVR